MSGTEPMITCRQYIDEHLEEEIDLESAARSAGYSTYHFARLFRRETGLTVRQYITQRRMIRASEDILRGASVTEVAFAWGYQTHGGFTRAFKRLFGFPPELLKAFQMQAGWQGGEKMEHIFMKQIDEHMSGDELYRILLEIVGEKRLPYSNGRLREGYEASCRVYGGMRRYSGEEYVTHPMQAAILLAELSASENAVIAGMLCDAETKTGIDPCMLGLPAGVTAILSELVACVGDWGYLSDDALLVKLMERLHNMRTVQYMDESIRREKAQETLTQFLPICARIPDKRLAAEMNELALRYL